VCRANDGCARAAATFMAAGSSLINYVDFIEPRILFTCSLACVCVRTLDLTISLKVSAVCMLSECDFSYSITHIM
jgi:hypothetical protein